MKATVEGVSSLRRKLRALDDAAQRPIREVIGGWAQNVEATAKVLAPERTGRLREAITAVVDMDGLGARVVGASHHSAGADNPGVYYGFFVEFGTVRTPPQPFLLPAYRAHKRPTLSALKREVRRALRAEARR